MKQGKSRVLALLLFLLSFQPGVMALQRCKQYEHDVKRFHYLYFGVDFPYGYSVAQLHKESLCRNNILSSDGVGSEGLAQITFKVWEDRLKKEGIKEIKTIPNHIRAQAYINRVSYDSAVCKKLWVMYQIYNGGALVNTEILKAGSCDWLKAFKACKRKDVVFKNGQRRNACTINYEYSQKIYELAHKHYIDGNGSEGEIYKYW